MKKSNMLIAVLAVMTAAAAVAKAEDIGLDFDGGAIGNHSLSLTELKRALPDFEAAIPVPAATGDAVFYKLGEGERKSLRRTIQETAPSIFDQKVLSLINDEKTDILYNNKNVFFVIAMDENKYKTLLESDDSRLIHLLPAVNNQVMPQTKQLMQAVSVCALVEVVGGAYMMQKIREIWTQVWVETKKLVKECHTEYVPAPDTGGSGSTYHDGQGGNSNYDVNKSLK